MKQSRRAKRMERHHKRNKGTPAFNLVSLMDIFTILVFFLLVNSGEGEVLPSAKDVKLPESISEQKPRQNIVVMVTEKDILVQGTRIAQLNDVVNSKGLMIAPLKVALEAQNKHRLLKDAPEDKGKTPEVTIMGSKQIPYRLLKKVMATCTEAGFGKISLAVMQKTPQES
ncbi:MAG TPA: biopolymer transporter ExbD [Gammaproteobacteria bacterium]|nr:biopolymer transporter ExbD [Gammaproteobacteria bacterium]